tara:strand:- start:304 stop:627 length:324 start_codon:yes stop_codon:yes gene_type:complete
MPARREPISLTEKAIVAVKEALEEGDDGIRVAVVGGGCSGSSCHRTSCPPLTGFSSRPQIARRVPNTKDNLRKWLKDPSSIKYGTAMPNLNLTDQEVEALIGHIETL